MAKEKATISATLGHEYEDLEEREDFLANNADSVDAECIIEESRDKIINTELDKIRKLCPEIPIMEV